MSINFTLSPSKFQEQVAKIYEKFSYPKIEVINNCNIKRKFILSPTQQLISKYFTYKNPNGILLYHSIGSGKTLTGVNLLKHFESKNYNTLWVTRTTLRKDLEKATDMIKLKPLTVISYKQFSNICKRKGENYRKLITKAKKLNSNTMDPFYKTIIIIDEAHKLYTKDLKAQEMHDINVIEKMIHESYETSASNRAKVVLMSATPITEDALEVVKLFNIIITKKEDRFEVDNFKQEYLDEKCLFTDNGKKKFNDKTKGIISFIDMAKDPTKFAQTIYKNIIVPISVQPKELDTELGYCKKEYKICRIVDIKNKDCAEIMKKCSKRITNNKKIIKQNPYQLQELKDKCNLELH